MNNIVHVYYFDVVVRYVHASSGSYLAALNRASNAHAEVLDQWFLE
jgi:hypothetical protein